MAMTSDESAYLQTELSFKGRVRVSLMRYATAILNEPTSTSRHKSGTDWAQDVYRNPDVRAQSYQPAVVMDPGIQQAGLMDDPNDPGLNKRKISAATDAEVDAATQAVVNQTI